MRQEDQDRYPPTIATLKNGEQVSLRFLALGDAQALGDCFAAMPRATYRFYSPHPLDHAAGAAVAALALCPRSVALVAENAAHEIGAYAWYRWKADDSRTSTFGICLHPDYRGIGLGQAMIARLLAIAARVGPAVMSLTVQLANTRALALYRKMGFRVVRQQVRGQVDEFPPEPEYYMEQPTREPS